MELKKISLLGTERRIPIGVRRLFIRPFYPHVQLKISDLAQAVLFVADGADRRDVEDLIERDVPTTAELWVRMKLASGSYELDTSYDNWKENETTERILELAIFLSRVQKSLDSEHSTREVQDVIEGCADNHLRHIGDEEETTLERLTQFLFFRKGTSAPNKKVTQDDPLFKIAPLVFVMLANSHQEVDKQDISKASLSTYLDKIGPSSILPDPRESIKMVDNKKLSDFVSRAKSVVKQIRQYVASLNKPTSRDI